eukprot:GHVQ01033126.1.p1 GENE.GHVQ01033126.1~~GHVQ01033126.1.p1  ORF type:complete len:491 (+),score=86.49 GHVQ01033126.1:88-1560(+)
MGSSSAEDTMETKMSGQPSDRSMSKNSPAVCRNFILRFMHADSVRAILCVLGIYVFFMSFAFVQEQIYRFDGSHTSTPSTSSTDYVEENRFTYSIFLVFVMCVSNAVFSYLYILTVSLPPRMPSDNGRKEKDDLSQTHPPTPPTGTPSASHTPMAENAMPPVLSSAFFTPPVSSESSWSVSMPFRGFSSDHLQREVLFTAITYVTAMLATNYALTHVSYPSQVLVKSAKMVPVVIGGFLVFNKTYPWYDYFSVVVVTIAIAVFNFFGTTMKTPKSIMASPHNPSCVSGFAAGPAVVSSSAGGVVGSVNGISTDQSGGVDSDVDGNMWGMLLLVVSLVCDGLTGPRLDRINSGYKNISSVQVMLFVNLFAIVISGLATLILEWMGPLYFCVRHPVVVKYILVFCVSASLGQFCIFFGLRIFGSLYLTFITTTRKFFTVVFSVLWFDHHLNFIQWACMLLVFTSLTTQSYFSKVSKLSQQNRTDGGEAKKTK